LFSIITKCIHSFSDSKVRKKLDSVEKELQLVKKDNAALARYINTRRKEEAQRKEEVQKKAEEEARREAMVVAPTSDESQSFKDVQTWRK
jgi:predicted Holliday junction resolvase-like endonuclease